VVENFSTTPAVEKALALMAEAYIEMDLQNLAQDSQRILQANYPQSRYLPRVNALLAGQEAPPLEENPSLLSRVWELI
jgi:outer membrane protein assembly factor BamD (BamD/ComL family)